MRSVTYVVMIMLSLCAQGWSQSVEKTSLISLIEEAEQSYGVVFSYNPELLNHIKVLPSEENDLEALLGHLTETSAFNFEQVDDENVIVSPKSLPYNLLVQGTIHDDEGEPLVGATIRHESESIVTSTNENGSFRFLTVYRPNDSLEIGFIGFASKKIALSYVNEAIDLTIVIRQDETVLGEVVVRAYLTSGIDYNQGDQSIRVRTTNAGLLPGQTETDILTSLNALPGINSPDGKAGNLNIRGVDPDKTLITFDNIPIYHLGHYFGTFSPYNTQIVDEVKIQRNGSYGAEKGGRVGGMVEISTKDEILKEDAYTAGVATSYYFADAQVPVVKNKLGILVGGRSSYPFNWNSPKINSINEFIYTESLVGGGLFGAPGFELEKYAFLFNDLNGKMVYQPNRKHSFSVSALRIDNQMHYITGFLPAGIVYDDSVRLKNWGVNLSATNKWTRKLTTKSNVTVSDYYQDFTEHVYDQADVEVGQTTFRNNTRDLRFHSITSYEVSPQSSISSGYSLDRVELRSLVTSFVAPGPRNRIDSLSSSFLHSVFANYAFFDAAIPVNFTLGLRSSYYTPTEKVYLNPRVMINAFLNDNVTLKGNVGTYNQYVNQVLGTRVSPIGGVDNFNWQISDGDQVKVVRSQQAMIGGMYTKKGFVLDVEGFYNHVQDVTSYRFIGGFDGSLIYGEYINKGVDVLLKKSYKNIEGWISYSYTDGDARFDTLEYTHFWNQRHVFSAVASAKWKAFKFSAGWSYRSGLNNQKGLRTAYFAGSPVFPGNLSGPAPGGQAGDLTFIEGSDTYYPDFFPSNHQLDISAAYRYVPPSEKVKVNFGVSLLNVYDKRIITGQVFRPVPDTPPGSVLLVSKRGLGFTPSALLSVSW